MVKLEVGHVVRLRGSKSVQGDGNVRFVNRKADRLFIDDPEYMLRGDVVRVMLCG